MASTKRLVEPWYLSCALIAFTTTGIVPILLPLEVVGGGGTASQAGGVMAAIGAGMLTAPLFGSLADRWRCHRALVTFGALAVFAALHGFAVRGGLLEWLLLAFLLGAGIASAFTVANMILVASEDSAARLGWFQTLVTGGTVAGLAAAGVVSGSPPEVGFRLGGLACRHHGHHLLGQHVQGVAGEAQGLQGPGPHGFQQALPQVGPDALPVRVALVPGSAEPGQVLHRPRPAPKAVHRMDRSRHHFTRANTNPIRYVNV